MATLKTGFSIQTGNVITTEIGPVPVSNGVYYNTIASNTAS